MKLTDLAAGAGHPVAFYPRLCALTGSINAALLLCQLIYWHGKQRDKDGWIEKRGKLDPDDPEGRLDARHQSLEHETGLTYRQQMAARRRLIAKGFLHERRDRLQHRTFFRLDVAALDRAWQALAQTEGTDAVPASSQTPHGQNPNGISPDAQTSLGEHPSGISPNAQTSLRENPDGFSRNAQTSLREDASRISLNGTYIDYTQTTTQSPPAAANDTAPKANARRTGGAADGGPGNKPKKKDLVDLQMEQLMPTMTIRRAIETHWPFNVNWEAKYAREWLQWARSAEVTAEQLTQAAELWRSDKRFNWRQPSLSLIFQNWPALMKENNPEKPVRDPMAPYYFMMEQRRERGETDGG